MKIYSYLRHSVVHLSLCWSRNKATPLRQYQKQQQQRQQQERLSHLTECCQREMVVASFWPHRFLLLWSLTVSHTQHKFWQFYDSSKYAINKWNTKLGNSSLQFSSPQFFFDQPNSFLFHTFSIPKAIFLTPESFSLWWENNFTERKNKQTPYTIY